MNLINWLGSKAKNCTSALFLLIFLAVLAMAPPTANADDHGNDDNSASTITVGASRNGNIEVGGDVDFFSFTAVEGFTYEIETISGTLDNSVLVLYDTDGNTVITSDNDSGEELMSKITWECNAQGTYYIAVLGYWSDSVGSYAVSLMLVASRDDDHSNDFENATPININTSINGNIEIGGDYDYFRFSANAGSEYILSTTLVTLDDSIMALFDTDGTTQILIDDDGGIGFASKITWTCNVTGTYYVGVIGYWVHSVGTYRISLDCVGDCGNIDDHGNNYSTASSLSIGAPLVGLLNNAIDEDWFMIPLISENNYSIEVTPNTLSDATLEFYGTDGTTIISSDVDGDSVNIQWRCTSTGMYYISVAGLLATGEDSGTYTVLVKSTNADNIADTDTDTGGGGGSCFIATASYGQNKNSFMANVIENIKNLSVNKFNCKDLFLRTPF